MDVTSKFKATVKALKIRHKAQEDVNSGKDANSIFPPKKKTSDFAKQISSLVCSVTTVRDFLNKNRKDYLRNLSVGEESSGLSDAERDEIDADTEAALKQCSESLQLLRRNVDSAAFSAQRREHHDNVFAVMKDYLRVVTRLYSEQRAVRVSRAVQRAKFSRLDSDGIAPIRDTTASRPTAGELAQRMGLDVAAEPEVGALSADELLQFQEENDHLFMEVNSQMHQVKQIEGKVVEVARLQQLFTEKILEQEIDINHIAEESEMATENIKEGNEEVRNAMKNNASFRVWIIFCLVTISFTLLFLHWYND